MRGQLDKVRVEREERIREDIRINGPKWIPEINRHFMDADNSTTDFGEGPQFLMFPWDHNFFACHSPTVCLRLKVHFHVSHRLLVESCIHIFACCRLTFSVSSNLLDTSSCK
jgi:hypothetical protein